METLRDIINDYDSVKKENIDLKKTNTYYEKYKYQEKMYYDQITINTQLDKENVELRKENAKLKEENKSNITRNHLDRVIKDLTLNNKGLLDANTQLRDNYLNYIKELTIN